MNQIDREGLSNGFEGGPVTDAFIERCGALAVWVTSPTGDIVFATGNSEAMSTPDWNGILLPEHHTVMQEAGSILRYNHNDTTLYLTSPDGQLVFCCCFAGDVTVPSRVEEDFAAMSRDVANALHTAIGDRVKAIRSRRS